MTSEPPDIDPLSFLPIRYEDRRGPVPSSRFREGEKVLFKGMPASIRTERRVTVVTMRDSHGYFLLKFFNFGEYHKSVFKPGGREVCLYGEPRREKRGVYAFYHPRFPDERGRIVPVYRCPKGVGQKRMRAHVWRATLALIERLEDDPVGEHLLRRGLPTTGEALRRIHNPIKSAPDESCFLSLAYRELFLMRKRMVEFPKGSAPVVRADMGGFFERLPFVLTRDQMKAVEAIVADMESGRAMRRILVGDVGSGKTAVAMAAAYACMKSGLRTLVLAPTTVLAAQLYENLSEFFGGRNVSLYTGRTKEAPSLIVVGTHALLNGRFQDVALVIVDEQHKYGVIQRGRLLGEVHALQMTATPIPRTFGLLLQGAIDISVLAENPFKRDVITEVVPESEKDRVLGHLDEVIKGGGKALVIFPLVSEDRGRHRSVCGMKDVWEKLYPGQVLWVHGRVEEKAGIVREFRTDPNKKVLIATSLIENGIDVEDASFLVVSGAEKFGLSQLHQLRGRIGRRGNRSYCYLIHKDPEAGAGLKPLERLHDGFALAEADSDLRGWGDAFGEEQSGHFFGLPRLSYYKKVIRLVDEDVKACLRASASYQEIRA